MRHVLSYFKCVLYVRSLHKFSSILSVAMSTLEPVWRPSRRWGITVGQTSRKVLCWEEQHQRHCPGWTLSPSGMSYVVLGSWPNLSEPPFVIHKIAQFSWVVMRTAQGDPWCLVRCLTCNQWSICKLRLLYFENMKLILAPSSSLSLSVLSDVSQPKQKLHPTRLATLFNVILYMLLFDKGSIERLTNLGW